MKHRWMSKLAAATAVGLGLSLLGPVGAASADTEPEPGVPATASVDALPTVQIDGVVWSQAVAGNRVYAGGQFGTARPAGAAAGTNTVVRQNILAYDITTGALLQSWAPALNGVVQAVAVSPDGTRVYAGGSFTTANGQTANRIVALDASTGAIIDSFRPNINSTVRALAATNTTVYAGGSFSVANGVARSNLAAFRASDGALVNWAPSATGGAVRTMTMKPDGTKLVVGGMFNAVNGSTEWAGMAAIDAATGATVQWESSKIIRNVAPDASVLGLSNDGEYVYGTGFVFGSTGNLEGVFAADWTDGTLKWIADCHGDNYGAVGVGDVVYSVGHSHDCSNIGYFPNTTPNWTFYRGQAFTKAATQTVGRNRTGGYFNFEGNPAPSMLHWFPDFAAGTFTGQNQGPWNIVSNGQYIAAGGEFPRVNGTGQQGLVRFTFRDKAPNKVGPALRGGNFKVNALSVQPGAVRISWTANHDRDNENLTYTVLRGGSPIATLEQKSNNWTRPTMGHIDRNLAPGSYSYRVQVADPLGNSTISDNIPVTVSNDELAEYPAAVLADGASMYWRLGEPSGTGVFDWAGFNDGLATASGLTRGTPGAIGGDSNTATGFDGATGNVATTAAAPGPGTFGVETWVRTTSTSGGKILGFGNAATGNSSSYDRHLYMTNDGRFVFGVYPGFTATVQSKAGFNDGQWHHVAAGLSADGLVLYVDGKRVARNTGVTSAQDYSGFWRVGGDNLNGWPSRPSSSSFAGEIDDVAVYPAPLTPAAVTNHYTLSGRTPASGVRPADAYGQAVFDKQPDLYWRLNDTSGTTAKDITVNENDGTYFGGPGLDAEGILPGTKAVAFDGGDDGVGANTQASNPTVYSQEAWFNTTSTAGGKIIGFGSAQSGGSGSYDRHVYMFDDGRLRFGVWTGQTNVIDSAESYNDGDWHHLVATQGPDGMKLYVDGELVGTNPQTQAQAYNGYWRLGGDTTWGGNSSNYFNGLIDEAAVYSQVLTPAQIAPHYALGGGDVPPPPNQEPTASFTAVADGLAVAFDATGSSDPEGQPLTYAWDFGDGTSSTEPKPTKDYGTAGTYNVRLVVTDAGGLTGSVTKEVAVALPNLAPTAAFTAVPDGLAVLLDAAGSSDPEGQPLTYAWDFGDGTTGTGATTTKTYGAAGTYQITLTVTDAGGLTNSRSAQVEVTSPPPGNTSPTANFTANATGLKVDLDASASTDEEGPIASYAWDFGDGTTGSGATATKTYASAGTYNVQLTVTDAGGLTDSRTLPVAVAGPTVWVSDTFSRTVVNGFGTAEIGGAWSMSGSSANYRVDGSAAVMRLGAPASQTTAWLGSVARTSSDVAVQISSDKAASGGGTYVTVVPRRISATNDYKTAIRILPTGQVTATLRRTVSGAETVIASGTVPGVSFAAGTKLNVRAQAVGAGTTTVRLKVWADGTAEPANWQFSVNDSTAALQTAGGVGFIAYLSGSASNAPVAVTFDNLQVGEAQ